MHPHRAPLRRPRAASVAPDRGLDPLGQLRQLRRRQHEEQSEQDQRWLYDTVVLPPYAEGRAIAPDVRHRRSGPRTTGAALALLLVGGVAGWALAGFARSAGPSGTSLSGGPTALQPQAGGASYANGAAPGATQDQPQSGQAVPAPPSPDDQAAPAEANLDPLESPRGLGRDVAPGRRRAGPGPAGSGPLAPKPAGAGPGAAGPGGTGPAGAARRSTGDPGGAALSTARRERPPAPR